MTVVWGSAKASLAGLPGDRGLNIGYEAIDRHVIAGNGDAVGIRWIPKHGAVVDMSYRELQVKTNRFANALAKLGLTATTGVATLLGRVPELYVTALGTLKSGGVYTPLFSAFGPDPIAMRLNLGETRLLVTTAALYRRNVAAIRNQLPTLQHVLIVGEGAAGFGDKTVLDFATLVDAAADDYEIPSTQSEDWALLHFTSGTTGQPKGVVHVHEAVVAHQHTGSLVLNLKPGDVFWCTSDPGWVTGTSYGIISPLVNGVLSVVYEAEFDAERWYGVIESQQVDVLYTAPTALRMLQAAGTELSKQFDLSSLKLVASVGEPLAPELVLWARDVFGAPVLDTWWQTETGGIMIANLCTDDVKPGSMGRPLEGIEAGLLRCDTDGELILDSKDQPIEIDNPDEVGELALVPGWPSMFRGYLHNNARYEASFAGRWYLTGDLAKRDADGRYWFVGRNGDVIKSAGHLIGPFEVESALNEHPLVLESGVIGKPDATVGAIVKAFVTLVEGANATDQLRREIVGHARKRLGPAVAPREIEFVLSLPHTRSGKIMRRLLKAREVGLDEGDLWPS